MEDLLRLLGRRIHLVEVAAVLKDNQIAVRAGEFDVVIGKVGDFAGLFSLRVVDKDIHRAVAVGDVKDFVANPTWA